ncbi:MAG: 2-oxoglutarate dehydrogenase E1 component [Rhodospirillales bacterium]|nr:2-oxoglutarate dehydrogenase E1 component [Rhodospirillales bacterium]USO07220.1 MAG: 2-oxoglutarate dehydrogenase E1 component [Rhodospirillales bacterium]
MTPSANTRSLLTGVNAEYIAHLYAQYLRDPASVQAGWASFFRDLSDDEVTLLRELHGPSWAMPENRSENRGFTSTTQGNVTYIQSAPAQQPARFDPMPAAAPVVGLDPASGQMIAAARDTLRAMMLIRAYRIRGHFKADLDPLGLREVPSHPELEPAYWGFTPADMERVIFVDGNLGFQQATLREILARLHEIYCGTVGVEYMYVADPEQRFWIQDRLEKPENKIEFDGSAKKKILGDLTLAEGLEKFLQTKFVGTKRFGLEGGESMIAAVEEILDRGSTLGLSEVVFGMAHRGRLNMLTNVLGKPFVALLSEFQGTPPTPGDFQGSGDVKYHLGASSDRRFSGGTVHVTLTPNPSHLEAVNPVVAGRVRAKQEMHNDAERHRVMPLLIHGDAAFAGQGIVAETLMMSELHGYKVGGTVHVVINNQIGFTTMPSYSRSGPYCTDVAKMLAAPIFHVNGDDPEAVVRMARTAIEFRQQFKKDVVLDITCYRRHGHNESDEPAFTQPHMYKVIAELDTTRTKYAKRLAAENAVTEAESQAMVDEFRARLEKDFESAKTYMPNRADTLEGIWTGIEQSLDTAGSARRAKTAISADVMEILKNGLTTVPSDFDIHPKIARQLEAKRKMFETGEGFDWGTAEACAFGSLLIEGHRVRISGQDVGRGTFSHRHCILYDQTSEKKYHPLRNLSADQGNFEAFDSPLSENAVLGFDYGYSLAAPGALVCWEGQFGDFVNGAQVMIDQFISSAETKWLRMSGLVMLLPHGMEGQGPEHSSARPERFLQQSAEDNWSVVNITTPANYFHALRRQLNRNFRKPLIVMSPKSLLRHKRAVSRIGDFLGESMFHRVLWDEAEAQDQINKPRDIRRIVLCSGKLYYDLYEAREAKGIKDVVILRVEQLYPWPADALAEELKRYPNADVVWCQEEPGNQGYWSFVDRRIENVLTTIKHKAGRPKYVGRPDAAAPATGSAKRHASEQAALIDAALSTGA